MNTPEYRIEIKVKNNYLYSRMVACGYATASQLARASRVGDAVVGEYLNLKKPPISTRKWKGYEAGEWKQSILAIAKTLNCSPAELFPSNHYLEPLKTNTYSFTLDKKQLANYQAMQPKALGSPYKDSAIREMNTHIKDFSTRNLKKSHAEILSMRYVGGMTYDEISKAVNLTRERIRQIEKRCLHKFQVYLEEQGITSIEDIMEESYDTRD